MSGSMFTPDGAIDTAKLDSMSQDELMQIISAQKASMSQGQKNPFAMYQQAMQQKPMQGQVAPPQVRRGQAANILGPLDELMKMQQMQGMRKRPQSLL